MGKSLPESCVGLFTTLCTEWILNKHIKTNMFAQYTINKKIQIATNAIYISP